MRLSRHILWAVIAFLATACGTGVETGKRVTERDVQRVVEATTTATPLSVYYADSVPAWTVGKRFYVTDDTNHIPIRLDMFLKFGSAKAFLTNMKGARSTITSLVN